MLGVDHATVADDRRAVGNPTDEEAEAPQSGASGTPGVGNPTDEAEADDPAASPELDPPTPAEKDAARKKTGAQKRKAKHAEDDAAPKLTADLHHGAFSDHAATLPDGAIALLLTDPPYGSGSVLCPILDTR